MEFKDKLKNLRKSKELTQEDLAEKLFVSRTAISKWETGKGYPNLESLQAISNLFEVSINDLLSGEELIDFVRTDKKKSLSLYNLLSFVCCGIFTMLLSLMPFFANEINGYFIAVNLFHYQSELWIIIPYHIIFWGSGVFSITELLTYFFKNKIINKVYLASIIFDIISIFLFIASRQPYVSTFVFGFLIIKAVSTFIYYKKSMLRKVSAK